MREAMGVILRGEMYDLQNSYLRSPQEKVTEMGL
jgi:hypothetical protein